MSLQYNIKNGTLNTRPEQGNSVERYQSATVKNKELFITGDVNASSEYIFDNQKEDGRAICDKFYETNVRVMYRKADEGRDGRSYN
jgi:hypothetical protein